MVKREEAAGAAGAASAASTAETKTTIGARWKALSDEERARFEQLAEVELTQYNAALAAYTKSEPYRVRAAKWQGGERVRRRNGETNGAQGLLTACSPTDALPHRTIPPHHPTRHLTPTSRPTPPIPSPTHLWTPPHTLNAPLSIGVPALSGRVSSHWKGEAEDRCVKGRRGLARRAEQALTVQARGAGRTDGAWPQPRLVHLRPPPLLLHLGAPRVRT